MIAIVSSLGDTRVPPRPNACPALTAAEEIAALEDRLAASDRQLNATAHTSPVLAELEAASDALIMAVEDARAALAAADPTSIAGAVAQLLAAIHDIRVCDDAETLRARVMEAKAMRFLKTADILGMDTARRLSQTRYPAPYRLGAETPPAHV